MSADYTEIQYAALSEVVSIVINILLFSSPCIQAIDSKFESMGSVLAKKLDDLSSTRVMGFLMKLLIANDVKMLSTIFLRNLIIDSIDSVTGYGVYTIYDLIKLKTTKFIKMYKTVNKIISIQEIGIVLYWLGLTLIR